MSDLCRLMWSAVFAPFRSRAALHAEILFLRHQLNVLHRRSPKRVALSNIDRLVFAGLYCLAPQVLDALKILKPETASARPSNKGGNFLTFSWRGQGPGSKSATRDVFDERSLQVDLVRGLRTVPLAGCVACGNPVPSTQTQCAASQIAQASGSQQ